VFEHPVGLVIDDDLRRSRLTVFFRLLLAIPHLIWLYLWAIAAEVLVLIGWFCALVVGHLPRPFHRFLRAFVRYQAQLYGYLTLAGNPYPPFTGTDPYAIDLRLPEPGLPLKRWKVLLRLVLAIPAFLLLYAAQAIAFSAAFLGWFACVVLGRMPRGLRDAAAYAVGYNAQVTAYLLLLTDRYPSVDPSALLTTAGPPAVHPIHIVGDADDVRRSRVMVFFRLALAVPHLLWLYLWGVLAAVTVLVQWVVTLIRGRPAVPLHRFLTRYVRYAFHVTAFLFLAANPFPGFTGAPGRYPLDLVLPPPGRQNRWKTLFRIVLVLPAAILNGAVTYGLELGAFLTWFAALITGRAPVGLRNLEAYALRYAGQVNGYVYLLTDTYPNGSPLEGAQPAPELEPEPRSPLPGVAAAAAASARPMPEGAPAGPEASGEASIAPPSEPPVSDPPPAADLQDPSTPDPAE
jgi:Domain of unknown function (DUF4389)